MRNTGKIFNKENSLVPFLIVKKIVRRLRTTTFNGEKKTVSPDLESQERVYIF